MTTQQTPKQVLEQLGQFIDQQEVARAGAQALALQWQATADAQRAALDAWQARWDALTDAYTKEVLRRSELERELAAVRAALEETR